MSTVILVSTLVPTVWGYATTPADLHYSGLAFNYQDDVTYLAKIREGMRGDWLFTLPYAEDPGEGAYFIYANYLALGHLGAWLNLEPVVVFHLFRLVDGAILLASLYFFAARFFDAVRDRQLTFLLAAVGAGLGWLLLPLRGSMPEVVEAHLYPYLSIFSNLHLPLAMAAQLWLIDLVVRERAEPLSWLAWLGLAAGTLILIITQPYGIVTVSLVAGLWLTTRFVRTRSVQRVELLPLVVILLISAPIALYVSSAIRNNPALASWDQQNVTLSPSPLDYLLAIGLLLPLALVGIKRALRQRSANDLLLIYWVAVTAILVSLPFLQQQRRFGIGIFIALVVLAVQGLVQLAPAVPPLMRTLLIAISGISNLVLLAITLAAVLSHHPYLFFSTGEWNGLMYLRTHAETRSVVLASPEMALYIPAWSGQRVVYGHPYETPNAHVLGVEVQKFFAGNLGDAVALLQPVDYIFIGARERAYGSAHMPPFVEPVFSDGEVTIYARR